MPNYFLPFTPFLFLLIASVIVFGAKYFVKKYDLDKKVKFEYDDELTAEELEKFKFEKAVANVKMWGMLVALPGVILTLVFF